jgi:hypothetical protein
MGDDSWKIISIAFLGIASFLYLKQDDLKINYYLEPFDTEQGYHAVYVEVDARNPDREEWAKNNDVSLIVTASQGTLELYNGPVWGSVGKKGEISYIAPMEEIFLRNNGLFRIVNGLFVPKGDVMLEYRLVLPEGVSQYERNLSDNIFTQTIRKGDMWQFSGSMVQR